MTAQTMPPGTDPFSGLAQYRLDDAREIERHLGELVDMETPVHLSLRDGRNARGKLTAVVGARRHLSLVLDGESTQPLPAMRHDDAVACVAYPGSVKLLFEVSQLRVTSSQAPWSYETSMPAHMYRIQRRESYRVRTIERDASVARLSLPRMPGKTVELKIHDVSITGCALIAPREFAGFESGQRIANVELELNADTYLRATIYVHHVLPQADGIKLGCSLMNVDGISERALQRYIFETQKRRRWATALI